MKIFAHRGASRDAPENSLAAFRMAWRQGADGAELDVHLSRDGRVMVCHDANTRRTTGVKCEIAQTGSESLRNLSLTGGAEGERIPFLEEVVAEMPKGKSLLVEIKCGEEIVPALVALKLPEESVGFLCFDADVLAAVNRALPVHRCLLNVAPKDFDLRGALALVDAGFDGVSVGWHRGLGADVVASMRAAGLEVAVWTVDDPDSAVAAATMGIDLLMSNVPGWLLMDARIRKLRAQRRPAK